MREASSLLLLCKEDSEWLLWIPTHSTEPPADEVSIFTLLRQQNNFLKMQGPAGLLFQIGLKCLNARNYSIIVCAALI